MGLIIGQEISPTLELAAVGFDAASEWTLNVTNAALTMWTVHEAGGRRLVVPMGAEPLVPTLRLVAGPMWDPRAGKDESLIYAFGFVAPVLTTFAAVDLAGERLLEVAAADVPGLDAVTLGFEVVGPAAQDLYFRFAAGVSSLDVISRGGWLYLTALASEVDALVGGA